tara:strand:+ start:2694 stop:4697 length:2004 start_codon:yes stop_codon:yes gene_type:complete
MDISHFQPFFDWVGHNPLLAGLIIFLISLSESLVIIGLFVPGILMMGIIGAFVGMGYLNIWATLFWSILGAIVGDGISFWIGRYYKERLRAIWLFKYYSNLILKGESFFKKHGGKSIVVGRFIGPIRPIIPAIAGMMHMPPKYFTFVNVVSAILWAPVYLFPGLIFGSSIANLPEGVATKLAIIVFLILTILWFIIKIIQMSVKYIYRHYKNFNHKCYLFCIKKKYIKILKIFHNSDEPEQPSIFSALLIIITLILFITLSINIITHSDIIYLNNYAHHFTRGLYNEYAITFFAVFSLLYDKYIAIIVFGCICFYLFYKKHYNELIHAAILITSSVIIIYGLKYLFDNPRPQDLFNVRNFNSYPSGHTILVTVIWGYMAILLARANNSFTSLKKYFSACLIIIVTTVCIGRLYLGDHWVADVIAGLLLGLILVLIINISYKRKPPSLNINYYNLVIIFFGTTIIFGAPYTYLKLEKTLKDHQPIFKYTDISQSEWTDNNKEYMPAKRSGLLNNKVSILNIQWADSLEKIATTLQKDGWKQLPEFNLNNIMHALKPRPNAISIPILPTFHNDKTYKASFIKLINKKIVTLRLWHSNYRLSDNKNTPIWIGTINYADIKRYLKLLSILDHQVEISNFPVNILHDNLIKNGNDVNSKIISNNGQDILLIK